MTREEIVSLVASGESERLEFKLRTGTRREAAKALCAMLNQQGGTVLFGITPGGKVVGQQVSERTMEEVSAEIRKIEPPVFPDVERCRVAGALEVIVVRVAPGQMPPYRYGGIAFRRIGNTTVAMSSDEHDRMLIERMHSVTR